MFDAVGFSFTKRWKKKAYLIPGHQFKSASSPTQTKTTLAGNPSAPESVVAEPEKSYSTEVNKTTPTEQEITKLPASDTPKTVERTVAQSKHDPIVVENLPTDNQDKVSRFSLSSIRLQKEAKQKSEKNTPETILDDVFDFTTFTSLWKTYAQQKQREGQSNIAALFSIAELHLESPHLVHVKVPSAINKVELEKEFLELKSFLSEKLNNNQIQFLVEVSPQKNKEYVITPEEKYQKLLEINPSIAELRKKLDLEF